MSKLSTLMFSIILFSSAVSATELSVNTGSRKDSNPGKFTSISEVKLQDDALGVQFTTGTVSRVEADYSLKVPKVPFVSVAVGAGAVSNGVAHYTYSVEPKITLPVGVVNVSASYQYRNAVKSGMTDKTNTSELAVSYAVNKKVSVDAKINRSLGDQRYNATFVGAAYTF